MTAGAPDRESVLRQAERTIRIEAEAVAALAGRLGNDFVRAIDILAACRGKVVVTGVGKSGLIGKKIAATLASTGTPSFFLHAGEAVHGDLGMLCEGDAVIAISNSGETEEIQRLVPAMKRLGLPLIGLTGVPSSTLGKASDVTLDVSIREEACPLGLAPTASTTATLAMGDALAVALLGVRGFREEDFAQFHPGGSLGRRWRKVSELMHSGERLPVVNVDTPLKDAIYVISSQGLGMTTVIDETGRLAGIITDGDLRRMIEQGIDFYGVRVGAVMGANPKRIDPDALAESALRLMESHSITSLVVTDANGLPLGVVHLHDLLRAGVV